MSGWEPDFLKTLPQPPDQPRSLFQPAPPPGPPPADLEHYFELDPLLDPPRWGNLGWFTDIQIQAIHPSLFFGQFRHGVGPNGQSRGRAPGAAKQDWTVAPRIEIGYRLPSGFGGFSFSDRFFTTSGTGPFIGPAGTMTRTTHFGVNYSDWDYISPEYTQWTNWGMTGARRPAGRDLDQHARRSAVRQGRSGTGIVSEQDSNYTVGAGPHVGLMLDRKFPASGFSFIAKFDIANTFTRERDLFSATNTSGNRSVFTQNYWQQVPILNYQLGVGWQPPSQSQHLPLHGLHLRVLVAGRHEQ